jgi:glycosyltransferase involved in cell wall biosynthesis
MRILQLIDSLETGGAERMAINYANALSYRADFSGLVATRKEGNLKNQIDSKVSYFFVNRKNTFDFPALLRLRNFCVVNKIKYIQAHSSSFFMAVLLKMSLPEITIIWHVHNGASESLKGKELYPIRFASYFFGGIITVNNNLRKWAEHELYCKKIIYLPNFVAENDDKPKTQLMGETGKRILCLANLRVAKNHYFLIEAAKKIKSIHPDWTFHLVGKDFEDDYSKAVKSAIIANNLKSTVFVYGAKNDVQYIISQSDISILTSQSEGLPVALLEYGLHKKPVVVTAVGEVPLIINNGKNGFIVAKEDTEGFYRALLNLIQSEALRLKLGLALENTIHENHSSAVVIDKLFAWL